MGPPMTKATLAGILLAGLEQLAQPPPGARRRARASPKTPEQKRARARNKQPVRAAALTAR